MKNRSKDLSLEYWQKLYEAAVLANADALEAMEKNMEQYLGSDEIDGSSDKAKAVRNITYECIESEISPDIPLPKAEAFSYSGRREENAKIIERLCSAARDRLPFEKENDLDERYTYIYGGSIWLVEWDSEASDGGGHGGVNVRCLSPTSFIPQPGILELSEMEYCFLKFTTTRGELASRYGISEDRLSLAECEYEFEGSSPENDTVAVITVFYRDLEGEIGKFVFSGELILSDVPNYYKRKGRLCKSCGKPFGECECNEGDFVCEDLEYETVEIGGESITIPYYTPKSFPLVIRRNTLGTPSFIGGSDCARIRSQQQAINKVESRILEKLLRAGVTPVIPEGSSVTLSNAVFGQVIRMRPGESLDNYGKLDTTPNISQDIHEADRLYDMAKRVLGISDALQGTDNVKTESGYARQLKINQAASRLETKRRMKYLAYSEIYRLIFEHYLAFADEERQLSYIDALGSLHSSVFKRSDFIEKSEAGYHYCDAYLFSVDLNSGNEYTRETLWARNLSNLESGTLGDKSDPYTLLRYWQSQERCHYPYARENVEYFKALIEKNEKESEKENERKEEPLQNP